MTLNEARKAATNPSYSICPTPMGFMKLSDADPMDAESQPSFVRQYRGRRPVPRQELYHVGKIAVPNPLPIPPGDMD